VRVYGCWMTSAFHQTKVPPSQTKPNQTKVPPNQTKPNQTKPNQSSTLSSTKPNRFGGQAGVVWILSTLLYSHLPVRRTLIARKGERWGGMGPNPATLPVGPAPPLPSLIKRVEQEFSKSFLSVSSEHSGEGWPELLGSASIKKYTGRVDRVERPQKNFVNK